MLNALKLAVPCLASALALAAAPLAAQSEAALREYFEGRTVTLKQPMPGTEEGVDIYPGTQRPLDYPKYAKRLKEYGTAIRAGQSAIVTKVKVKSKHLEFQLDGGGYGTMGDETSPNVSTPAAPQTRREKNLEAEFKREIDPAKRRAIREELDQLKREREREDARNRASVAEAEEHRKQNIRERRLEGGSRFNIRYRDNLPSDALSPANVMEALSAYVDFGPLSTDVATSTDVRQPVGTTTRRAGLVRKGMLLSEVDAMLGSPAKTVDRKEGSLNVRTREYVTPDGRITADFVEAVLVRYTMTSD